MMKNFYIDQRMINLIEKLTELKLTAGQTVVAVNVALVNSGLKIENKQDFDDFLEQVIAFTSE